MTANCQKCDEIEDSFSDVKKLIDICFILCMETYAFQQSLFVWIQMGKNGERIILSEL